MSSYKDKDLLKFFESFTKEEQAHLNELQIEASKVEYKDFITKLNNGECYLCGGQMNSIEESSPCFHWFTNPTGIKKKHFEKYLEKPIGFFQLDSYFRWLANTEKPLGNINDLKEETSTTSFLETTYKYKNIEWAFSIGHTDKEGHPNAKVGSAPHYHIQMKVDNRVFLKFNDFHIPFSDSDLFNLESFEQLPDLVKHVNLFGEGIGILEDETILEAINDTLISTDDSENATFNIQTLIEAPEGQTISGEIIQKAIEESKRTKEPVGRILQRLLSEAKITTILTPGAGVPKMTKRSGKKYK
jgi:hypothetical protein